MNCVDLVYQRYDGRPPEGALAAAEAQDRSARQARPARERLLADISDQADIAAIRTTDPDVMATKLWSYWLYMRVAGNDYPYTTAIADYLVCLHEPANLRSRDIRKLPAHSRVRRCRDYIRRRFHEDRALRKAEQAYRNAADVLLAAE